jgi:hypothetical protein
MRSVIDSQAAAAVAPKTARRRRQSAAAKLRPALASAVTEFLHKTFGRKNAGERYGRKRDMDDGGTLIEHAIDRRYDLIDLTAQPKRRGRPKGSSAYKSLGSRTDKEFTDAILGGCLSAWIYRTKGTPSEMTVAESIAQRLGITDDTRFRVGLDLLPLAYAAGIVRQVLRPIQIKGRTQYLKCVALTDEAAAALCDLESKENWPWPATGLHKMRVTDDIPTQQGSEQSDTPHVAEPGTAPGIAAERIRATEWQVSPTMLVAAGEWLQARIEETAYSCEEGSFDGPPTEKWNARKAADEYTAEIAAYRSIRHARKAGFLAVEYDHRGRIYQFDSLVTYTSGSDLARGILEFSKARRVETDAGMEALARHVLNQWDSSESRTVPGGSATDWLNAQEVLNWEKANEPLRFLAAHRAWNAALAGEPIRVPVSIDATTSVLQHMALLLRNVDLAKVSNLWPGERRDFYSEVAEAGNIVQMLPEKLRPKARKIVKANTMPAFYGKGEWTSRYDLAVAGVPKGERKSLYDAMKGAAQEIAPKAFELLDALQAVGLELAMRGEPVRWNTISGWHGCTAKLEQLGKTKDYDLANGKRVQRDYKVNGTKLSWPKQKDAITPNLIHSQDATLLHLAVWALPATVTSVAVAHDCFAVHADDVPGLRSTLMRTLDLMYAETDLLAGWWAEWGVEAPLPSRGVWDARFLQGEYTFC